MKKGFTLAELLGVIAILGILALIVVPVVNNNINNSREKLYTTQLNQMIKGTKDYYAEHLSELPNTNGAKVTITLGKLQQEGYLPLDADNPKTGKPLSKNSAIEVTNVTKNGKVHFEYKVLENTLE